MKTITSRRSHAKHVLSLLAVGLALELTAGAYAHAEAKPTVTTVRVRLSEWNVDLMPAVVPPGPIVFQAINSGTIPHALEVEGHGIERSVPQLQPGASARLEVRLSAGTYEVYCPVGKGSHQMLGMKSHLTVSAPRHGGMTRHSSDNEEHGEHEHGEQPGDGPKMMTVQGGGPVIQILPGPFPFADSAMAIIQSRPPDQKEDLTKKAHMGPYSNHVAAISGDVSLVAIDRGASGDSVSGIATFTTPDGARWKMLMDRVQTKDIPFNPRFGGVIMGLYYHGASGVHTPLVPTIQASLALWAYGHLYRNDALVTDSAMVHVMLLSRTRRPGDWSLECWDCSRNPIEELQLQVTPLPGHTPFDAPGGVLFLNWEKSSGETLPAKS